MAHAPPFWNTGCTVPSCPPRWNPPAIRRRKKPPAWWQASWRRPPGTWHPAGRLRGRPGRRRSPSRAGGTW